jgi:hypothetical protein
MKIENLAPNQIIIKDGKKTVFNSYGSNICEMKDDQIYLDPLLYDYSRTTSKYLSKFLGETKKEIDKKIKSGAYKLELLNI